MTPSRFLALPLAHALRAIPFSQRVFRRRHLPGNGTPLCSALVAGWLQAAKTGTDYFASLEAPGPGFLQRLAATQRTYAYPMPAGAALTPVDRATLRERYGLGEADTPEALLRRLCVPDFAAYDLQQRLGMRTVSLSSFLEAGGEFFTGLLAGPPQGLVLKALSIRHLATVVDGAAAHKSHRIGIALRDGAWSLFDPNAGCVEFASAARADTWLTAFWAASPYPACRACPGVPRLALYSMT